MREIVEEFVVVFPALSLQNAANAAAVDDVAAVEALTVADEILEFVVAVRTTG